MTERAIRRRLQEESGTALLASTMLVVLLTGAGMAAVMTTSVNQNRSKNVLTSKQAFYLADAGIQHAKTFLTQNLSNWNSYVANPPTQPLVTYPSLAGIGGYSVTVKAGGNGSLLLTSTGTAAGSAKAVVQSLMKLTSSYSPPKYAFISGKNLAVSNNDAIQGTGGGVHANGNLTILNSPTIATDATASGSYTNAGTPTIGGISGGSQPTETIPAISPTDNQTNFYASRDYRLASDGKVYGANGAVLATSPTSKQTAWNGWFYSSPTWTMAGSTINGTFYVEGNAVISSPTSAIGTPTTPWITTIIATQSIDISAKNIYVRAPMSTDGALYKAATQNILLLAGGDVFIHAPTNGTAQIFTGLVLAYEQIGVAGISTMTINGSLLAADAATQYSNITGDSFLYSGASASYGAPTINYDGNLSNASLGAGSVQTMTWQATQY